MPLADFALLALVCLIWAVHNIVSKIVVSGMEVPPLFYAAARFGLVALIALPWLKAIPRPWWRPALVGFCMGGGGFGLFFLGIRGSSPSTAAIVIQLSLPFTAILSVLMLGERIGPRRLAGMMLTFAGVVVVMIEPGSVGLSGGLLFVAGSALVGSLGAVMMKQVRGVTPMQFQALAGVTSVLPLAFLSAITEDAQFATALAAGWPFAAALLFSVVIVSLVSHSLYYRLIARHEASLIAPLMLMMPLMVVGLGVLITGDRIDLRIAGGASAALVGVLITTTGARTRPAGAGRGASPAFEDDPAADPERPAPRRPG
jgi:drug/metabolite transporter (DMT)-like permease